MTKKRVKSIEIHVRNDDYFGTLATMLDLIRQDMEKTDARKTNAALLERLRDDLLYLQDKYRIHRRIAP